MNYFYISIINLLFKISIINAIRPINFEKTNQGFKIETTFYTGITYEKQFKSSFSSLLDINANKTIIKTILQIQDLINTFPQTTLNISQTSINCFIIENSIYFDKEPLKCKSYVLINQQDDKYSTNSLPLSHTLQNSDFSLLHSLLNLKHISYLRFRLSPSKSKLYIGDISYNKISNDYIQTLTINPFYYTWGANLSSITFDYINKGFYYINNFNNYSYFTTRSAYITLNERIFKFLHTNVLQKFILNNTCEVNKVFDKVGLICKCSVIEKLPYIYFTFNRDKHIKMHLSKLFRECWSLKSEVEKTESFIRCGYENEYKENDIIEIGTYFLQQFETEFDLERKEINFYSKEVFPVGDILKESTRKTKGNNRKEVKGIKIRILKGCFVWLLCGILLNGIALFYFMK